MSLLDSNQTVSVGKVSKVTLYENRTSVVGNNYWKQIPDWAKFCRLVITTKLDGESATIVSRMVGRGQSAPSSEAPAGYLNTFSNAVQESTLTPTNEEFVLSKTSEVITFSVENAGYISFGIPAISSTGLSAYLYFYEREMPDAFYDVIVNNGNVPVFFKKFLETEKLDMYGLSDGKFKTLHVAFRNVVVFGGSNSNMLFISTEGFNGAYTRVDLNVTNFPGLIANSGVVRVFVVPWARNSEQTSGKGWRLVVVTNRGQIFHNYPSRATDGDGSYVDGDEFKFDESVVWESAERFTPVKTTSGTDATLIDTGKYKYMPCYPDTAYELHPAISTDNGYGNGGFPATITKVDDSGVSKTFGRFWFPSRVQTQANPFVYMGGYAPHEKLTLIGTYESNMASGVGCRICLFATNDGGRSWYNIYEFGAEGKLVNSEGGNPPWADSDHGLWGNWLWTLGYSGSVSSGVFKMHGISQVVPTADDKEPDAKFIASEGVAVTAISGTSDSITITTASEDGLPDYSVVCFTKNSGAGSTSFDWLVNDGDLSEGGNGVCFKVKKTGANTYVLHDEIHSPFNPLPARHVHSVDRCRDGYAISTGERYPTGGWILYMPVRQADSFDRKYPWDTFNFVRLNSTKDSVYRALGFQLMKDDSFYIGVDDALIPMSNAVMPSGRETTFMHGSTGVFKGKLSEVDSAASLECLLNTTEVSYLFKLVENTMVFIGQQGHIAVSSDFGKTWTEAKIPKTFAVPENYRGVTDDKIIAVGNIIIKMKV